jgi:hypothetical protein
MVVFTAGAVTTVAWAVGALVILLDLAIGATAPTYGPWLVAGALPLSLSGVGCWLIGGMPAFTLRTGCLGAVWGIGLTLFVGGTYDLLQGAQNVRLGGPAYQAAADDLVRTVIFELIFAVAVIAGVAIWRRRWFPTLAVGATVLCLVGTLDNIFMAMASTPF